MQDRQNRQLERELQQGAGQVGFAAVVPNPKGCIAAERAD